MEDELQLAEAGRVLRQERTEAGLRGIAAISGHAHAQRCVFACTAPGTSLDQPGEVRLLPRLAVE